MFFRFQPYRTAATWSNGGVYRLDLPEHGFLSSLYFHAYRAGVTDSMNAVEEWRLLDYVSELKVIGNGSEVLKNLTGRLAHFCLWDDGGAPMLDQHFNYGSSTKRMHAWLNFGRYPGDEEYGLDLGQWTNIELQFKNSGSSTYFGGDWSIDVGLVYMIDPPNSRPWTKHIRTEVWREITTVQDQEDYLNLPASDLLRRLIIQVDPAVGSNKNASATLYNVLENIRFTLQDGNLEVYDGGLRDLWYYNLMRSGRQPMAGGEPYHTSGYGIRTGLGQTFYKAAMSMPQSGSAEDENPAVEPGNDSSTQKMLRTLTDNYSAIFYGLALENCVVVPFNLRDDEAHYLDLAAMKTAQLQLTTKNASSAAGGKYRVVLDRLVANP